MDTKKEVNEMKMPGFTAEASLHSMRARYAQRADSDVSSSEEVLPQKFEKNVKECARLARLRKESQDKFKQCNGVKSCESVYAEIHFLVVERMVLNGCFLP